MHPVGFYCTDISRCTVNTILNLKNVSVPEKQKGVIHILYFRKRNNFSRATCCCLTLDAAALGKGWDVQQPSSERGLNSKKNDILYQIL